MEGRRTTDRLEPLDISGKIDEVRQSGVFDARSSSLPTWCPGCGYFGITHAFTRAIHRLELDKDEVVFVSGIGCAGRYPFFMSTYGFHSVHGRALPVATGIQMANPELTVLAVGGDGDGVGIGGGHLPHAARRNVNMVYVLFDNSIYGLTKGQVSPTSPHGFVSKTTPYGNPDEPVDPLVMALSYGAPFAARGFAGDVAGLEETFAEAMAFNGFAFVHVLTTCVTFDKVNATWDNLWANTHPLEEGYDSTDRAGAIARAMKEPYAVGVFHRNERPPLHETMAEVVNKAKG